MRIGFTGASGTGKSKLTEYLAEVFGLEVNPIGSRSVAKAMGFDSPYGVDAAGRRKEFQRRLLAEKTAWERERDRFVTDRTTLDNLAYSILHGVADVDAEFWGACFAGLARYDVIFALAVDDFCDPGDDAARVKDLAYHRCYEATLRGLLVRAEDERATMPGPPRFRVVPIREKSLDARKREIERFLRYRFAKEEDSGAPA